MARPTRDDTLRKKRTKQSAARPRRKSEPQHLSIEDRRLLQQGEKQGWESRGPESRGATEAGVAGKPTRERRTDYVKRG